VISNAIIIFCVSVLFYFKTSRFNYVSDDIPVYQKSKDRSQHWFHKRWLQLEGSTRVTPKQDHWITIIIHALVSSLIYVAFGATPISFMAALMFCFNPSNNQGSVWISGRGYVLPTMWFLLSMIVPLACPFFFYFASAFNAGFLAMIMFAQISPWFMLAIGIVWVFRWKQFKRNVKNKMDKEMFGHDKKIHPRKLILFFKTMGFYVTLGIIPFRNTFYHEFMQSAAGNDIMRKRAYKIDQFFFIGITFVSLSAWYILTHHNVLAFALTWYIVSIAPFCNLVRCSQEIAERYCYLPNVGLSYCLSYFIINVIGRIQW